MNILSTIQANLSPVVGRGMLQLSKVSPTLLIVGGVTGVVVSTVMACKATLQLDELKKEGDAKIDEVHKGRETYGEKYTDEAYRKDLLIVHTQKWVSIAKLYAPAAGLGLISVAAILGSHGIMTQRNAALMAAYKAIDMGYRKYRDNVVKEFGPEKDAEFRFGKPEVTEELAETAEGEPVVVQKKSRVMPSDYARFFDETSVQFRNDPIHNLTFLKSIQDWCNDLLNLRGHIFLNEVYDKLGLPRASYGQAVGWLKDSKNGGAGYVEFGLYLDQNANFINGYDNVALLDFNVDPGTIWNSI